MLQGSLHELRHLHHYVVVHWELIVAVIILAGFAADYVRLRRSH